MAKISLSPPWIIYYKELNAFFENDPDVKVLFDEEKNEIKLYVSDAEKAKALSELLPMVKKYEEVELKIAIIPANGAAFGFKSSSVDSIKAALKNNPIVDKIETVSGLFGYDLHYVLFKKEVVQYFTDNIGDYNGFCSTLYENIARDIFEDTIGVFFCTSDRCYHTFADSGICTVLKGSPITTTTL